MAFSKTDKPSNVTPLRDEGWRRTREADRAGDLQLHR
jgi:hypothetical protein